MLFTMKQKTKRECANPDCDVIFNMFKSTDKYCSYFCKVDTEGKPEIKKSKPINKKSKKQKVLDAKYSVLRIEFLGKPENQICPITKLATTDVHHKMGRIGFADQWARDNDTPLLLDTRFWVSLSREGHKYVEENPVWAKENGYSLSRLEKNGGTEENK